MTAALLALLVPAPALASDGRLDPSFGLHGVVYTDLQPGSGVDAANAGLLLSHGRILTVGGYGGNGIGLVRYKRNGRLDSSYNGDGIATYRDPLNYSYGADISRAGSGRIAVAGSEENPSTFDILVARFTAGGALDPTFGNDPPNPLADGLSLTSLGGQDVVDEMAVDRAGRVLVTGRTGDGMAGGENDLFVARYRKDGSLDPSFNGTGVVVANLGTYDEGGDLAVTRSGRILVSGVSDGKLVVLALRPTGARDHSFGGGDGLLRLGRAGGSIRTAVRILALRSGKVILLANQAFTLASRVVVVRLRKRGGFDRSFSGDGVKRIPLKYGGYGAAMVRDRKGRLVVVGGINRPTKPDLAAVWRLGPRGSLDRDFGKHGLVTLGSKDRSDYGYGVLIQPNQRIVVMGETYDNQSGDNRLVARLLKG